MINVSLLWELTKRDFSERFAGSVLGSLWALIWPLVNLAIYITIFGKLMGARLPGNSNIYAYGIYVAVGLVPWTALTNTISRSSIVFLDKKHLISKIKISLPSLLIYVSLSETITFIFSMTFLLLFLTITGYSFHIEILLIPFIYYLQQVFAFGLGLLAATFTVFIRDIREVIGVILTFWFWFTPIVYIKDILPDIVKHIMVVNPAYVIVDSYQQIFVFGHDPSYRSLMVLTLVAHAVTICSYFIFRSLERDVRDFL